VLTLDEFTLERDVTRPGRRAHASGVRPHWCEACREAHVWCDACGSLSCRHVLETVTPPHPADPRARETSRVRSSTRVF
jgi:hypothetical protein